MQHILVYSDSASWGIIPDTRRRRAFEERWPGVLELSLSRRRPVRVIEDCLNGRRTAWEDPFKPGRRGVDGIAQRIEIHSPLALVVLMLGTNDFQSVHALTAAHSAQGMAALVHALRQAPIEPGMPLPPVLIVAPPRLAPRGAMAAKFADADRRSEGLSAAYRSVAADLDCAFFDAASVIATSAIDGVHLDAEAHLTLGRALAEHIEQLAVLE